MLLPTSHARTQKSSSPFAEPGRFFVPDLSPRFRPSLASSPPRWVFVAESPHLSEVEPEDLEARRPLCGRAGQQWWGLVSELLNGSPSRDVSLGALLAICRDHRMAVINAVQYPLDPKITAGFAAADPLRTIGFSKAPGARNYKRMKGTPELKRALEDLGSRLRDPSLDRSEIYCLGLDSEWLVKQALGSQEFSARVRGRLPHPSAWWRKGGFFGRVAREKLEAIFKG